MFMSRLLTLRPSTPSDAALFYAVIDQTMRDFIIATWGSWDEVRVSQESISDSSSGTAQVIQVDGQDAGVLVVVEEENFLELQQLYLLPAYQLQGVGSELLATVVRRSAALGKGARLRVLRANPAKRFYERFGFIVTEEGSAFFQMERAFRK